MQEQRAKKRENSSSQSVTGLGLLPWQRFVLSVLLFLDVSLLGGLFLVVLGCVNP